MIPHQAAPTIRIPGNGRSCRLFDNLVNCTVSGEDTGGSLFMFEQVLAPGASVPQHIAREHETAFYVIEGKLQLNIGEQTVEAIAGTHGRVPALTVMSYENHGDKPVKLLLMVTRTGTVDNV